MRPKSITYTLSAPSANYFVTTVKPTEAGALTLVYNTMPSGNSARKISVTSAGNDSGRTFAVVGLDRYGRALTENITGPNTTTVYSTYNYSYITSITVDAGTAGNITVGTGNCAETQWIPVEFNIGAPYGIGIDHSSGAGLVEVEGTMENPMADAFNEHTCEIVDVDDTPVRAIRAKITEIDGTSGLTLVFTVICS